MIGDRAIESATLLAIAIDRLTLALQLDEDQIDAAVALAFQRARETTISPLESLWKSINLVERRRFGW